MGYTTDVGLLSIVRAIVSVVVKLLLRFFSTLMTLMIRIYADLILAL